jgi:hypothetical protein
MLKFTAVFKVAIAAFILCVAPLHAQHSLMADRTGNSLVAACTEDEVAPKAACLGFIVGAMEGWQTGVAFHRQAETICIPRGVEVGQMMKIILKYADDHPQDLHLPAGFLVVIAMQKAFRCDKTFYYGHEHK